MWPRLIDWRTNRKIVVFESDDWGSIRMTSREVFDYFKKINFPVASCVFNKYDSLESNDDLSDLLEVLSSVKDHRGASAIFTANVIVANPDFERIKESNYKSYSFELFTETLKKYPDSDRVFDLYKIGIAKKLFYPQFHGREHVHVYNWLRSLQENDLFSKRAFEHRMFTVSRSESSSCKNEFVDAFAIYDESYADSIMQSIDEGLLLFQSLFGYQSISAIAPCYIWDDRVAKTLFNNGVRVIQSGRAQLIPQYNSDAYNVEYKYSGQKNNFQQVYSLRNIYFEPCTKSDEGITQKCVKEIAQSFLVKRPAVISTHRVNYIGRIHKENKERNLELLSKLLKTIVRRWPDVEFMSTDQLGKIMLDK